MAEKELAILLTAKNMASGPIKRVAGDISTLDKVSGRAGKGVRTLGTNLKNLGAGLAIGGVVAGIAAIKSGLDSLAERENVISATNAAIAATGGKARVAAGEIRTWSEEIERATGAAVDDKAIQASANVLLRFTDVTEANFRRTLVAATDLGAAMKTGPEAAAKLLGKALSDPAKGMTALRKAGVILTKAEQERIKQLVKGNKVQAAQNFLLAAVESRYKGAAAASAGPYTRALNLLADASEDAKMALAEGFLPIIEKVADKLSGALANKQTIEDIRGLGKSIAGGFDAVLNAASQIPWDSIKDAMRMAGMGAKAAFDLFTGLPPWVQTAVITGWGLNKLTGGAVGGIVGELGKGLIKGVLGMNAGVVNINAGVVNGGIGGVGGLAGAAAGAGAAGIGVATVPALALIAASVAGTVLASQDLVSRTTLEQRLNSRRGQDYLLMTGGVPRRGGLDRPSSIRPVTGSLRAGDLSGRGLGNVISSAVLQGIRDRQREAGRGGGEAAVMATYQRNILREQQAARVAAERIPARVDAGSASIVSAIRSINIPAPKVIVTSRSVDKAETTYRNYSPHAPKPGKIRI